MPDTEHFDVGTRTIKALKKREKRRNRGKRKMTIGTTGGDGDGKKERGIRHDSLTNKSENKVRNHFSRVADCAGTA
jgi:hypothetical protein